MMYVFSDVTLCVFSRLRSALPLALYFGCLTGCGGTSPTAESQSQKMPAPEFTAPEFTTQGKTTELSPDANQVNAVDDGWLDPPANVNPMFLESYPVLRRSAGGGDPNGLSGLAFTSHQIGMGLLQSGQRSEGLGFLIQAGDCMRKAIAGGLEGFGEHDAANIFFSEATALSSSGDVTRALAALSDSVQHGFSNWYAVTSSTELRGVRSLPEFQPKFEAWVRDNATSDLATSETFPFELSLVDVRGAPVELADFKGKVVLVDIWGTWCPPCRAELPFFIRMQEENGDRGLQILGVNYERVRDDDQARALVAKFVEENRINYPCMLGDNATKGQIPGFSMYPTAVMIDRTGRVRIKIEGGKPEAYFEQLVSELLNEAQ